MNKEKPSISIFLPVYNAGLFLEACLESLRLQTYDNFEIIAIDDFSKDDSYAILKSLSKKDKRFRVFKNKKRYGLAVTLNRCMRKAKGDFIAFMDAHDRSTPDRLKRQLSYLMTHQKAVAVGTQCVYVNQNNGILGKSNFPTLHELIYHALPRLSLQPETVMINRNMIPKDILHFHHASYSLLYRDIIMKLQQYGEFANLTHNLYHHRQDSPHRALNLPRLDQLRMATMLWVKSVIIYGYRPSLRTYFPFVKYA